MIFKNNDSGLQTYYDYYASANQNPLTNLRLRRQPEYSTTMKTNYSSLRTMTLGAAAICSFAAMAVTNDITVVRAQPTSGNLDAEMRSLNEIAITLSQPVMLGETKKQATLTGVDGTVYKSDISVNAYTKSILQLDFGDVTLYNGTYTLIIPKWSVGDQEWFDNYEVGHSNAELKVEWNVYNALEYGKDYSLTPNLIQPADGAFFSYTNGVELQQIRITYYRDANLIPGTTTLLTCAEAKFNQELFFTAEKSGSKTVFTANVSPRPSVDGNYTLIIPAGTFGDDAYAATGEGAINPPIVAQYEVSGIPGQNGDDENLGETKSGPDFIYEPTKVALDTETMTATLTFAGTAFVNNAKLSDFRVVDENRYAVDGLTFSLVETDNAKSVAVKIAGNLTADANYTLVIPENFCGNSIWSNGNYNDGQSNPQILISFVAPEVKEESFFVEPIALPAEVKSVNPKQGLVDTSGSVSPLGVKAIAVQFNTNEIEKNDNAIGEFTLYKNGVKVASAPVDETYGDPEDETMWGFTFPGSWLNDGVYHVEIPAGVWLLGGVESPAISLNYEIFHTMEVSPYAGVVDKLDSFKINFPGAAKIEMNSSEIILYQDYSTNKWELESLVKTSSVMLGVDGAAVTADGSYSLELPKGLFTIYYEGKPGVEGDTRKYQMDSQAMILKYYISSMPKPAIEPAEGAVENFYEFTLTAPAGFEMWFIDDMGRSGIYSVLDDGTLSAEPVYKLRTSQDGNNAVLTVLNSDLSPVEAPVVPANGNYRLVLASSIFSGMYNGVQVNSIPYEYDYSVSSNVGVESMADDVNPIALKGIYNLQGIRIATDADAETVKALPRGLYIINGKKVVK